MFLQGFKDTSLTVWDASSILRNYEVRTGHILSREELDTGYLTDRLIDADYDLTKGHNRKATARAILQAYALPQRSFTKNIEAAQRQFESKF